ncbi:hypothetical protein [Candidatus Enterococcus clewellii]|uniref:Gram-positive cocci surface proteins LPxTG domain-containing protein n=1 Tax=Candidatus Enterococcus clewellii TaxID=1834193 RepID=A0A242K9H1_9ENTE|nr:hypothetical protein [Enterococcus sp. 9E7_DIV0242]OTP17707.1 hypothetical protein A5888_001845 [Enterococcus sp. 9E7_DIV0242]
MKAKKIIGLAGAVFLGASMGIITSQSAWADTVTDFETVNGQLVVSTSIDGQSKTMADGSEIRKDGERWYNDFGEVTITYNETVEKDVPVGQSIPTEVLEPSLEQIESFPPVVTQTIEMTVSNLETTSNLPQPDLQTPEVFPPTVIEEVPITEPTQPPISTKDLLETEATDSMLNEPQPVPPIVETSSKEERSVVPKEQGIDSQEAEPSAQIMDDQLTSIDTATDTAVDSKAPNTEAITPAIALDTFPKTNEQCSATLGISGVVLFVVGILGVFFKWRGPRADS